MEILQDGLNKGVGKAVKKINVNSPCFANTYEYNFLKHEQFFFNETFKGLPAASLSGFIKQLK